MSENQQPQSLGLATLVMLVVASMIGVGCFFSSGYALLSLGNPSRVVLAWLLCGVWALAGAYSYGALAKRVPISGGEYLYLSRLMHPSIGFLAGWISLVAGFTAPIAAMAKAFMTYAFPDASQGTIGALGATLVILIVCVLHAGNVQLGARVQNTIVAIKLVFIVGFLVWAGTQLGNKDVWRGGPLPERSLELWPNDFAGYVALLAAMSWMSLSYTGFNAAVYVAGESVGAQRNVPRAMLWATVLVMILYVLLNAVFVWAAPTESVITRPELIGLSAAEPFGNFISILLRAIVSLATLSSVFGMLMAGPRVYAQMAKDGVMPKFLSSGDGIPRSAIFIQALLSIVILWIAALEQLIGYLGITLSACSALAVSSLFFIGRTSQADQQISAGRKPEPVHWPEYAAAIIYVLGTVVMLVAVLVEGPRRRPELVGMVVTFAIGALIYMFRKLLNVVK